VEGACRPAGTGSSSGGFGTYCDTDAECTMDEFCLVEGHLCVSKHACNTNADCRQEGQECRDFDGNGYRECGFPGCNSAAECDGMVTCNAATERVRCEARACVCRPTCGGDCGMGNECCGVQAQCPGGTDACCIADPGPCGAATCMPGFAPNPNAGGAWSVNACAYQGVSNCECVELPPLATGIVGNPHTAYLDASSNLHAVAYAYGPITGEVPASAPYGDLVHGSFNRANGTWSWRFVDGVPATGTLTGGPSGPRGGIGDSGPDVGSQLDAAVSSDDTVHVAYRDRTRGVLKYARLQGAAAPVSFDLDTVGDTGIYPAVAVTSAGFPVVAWLNRRDDSPGAPRSTLRLAAATSAAPASAADFRTYTLSTVNLTTLACEGGCPSGTGCQDVVAPGIPGCVPVAQGCAACGMGQFCTAGGCVDRVPGSDAYQRPVGPGLMASLKVLPDGTAVLAVFDAVAKALVIHHSTGALDAGTATFAATTVAAAGQVAGVWPSVAVSPTGAVAVAFTNETTRALSLVELDASFAVTATRVVDDGVRTDGVAMEQHHLAEPALAFGAGGTLTVAYQDGTTGELLQAVGSGTSWTRTSLAGAATPFNGWFGFSTNILPRASGAPLVTTFRRNPDATPQDDGISLFNGP
jgi:hypothetical protein